MSMITTSFRNHRHINVFRHNFALCALSFAVAAVVGFSAHAQERDVWPRTFTGQPDFVFVKDEVLQLNKERAENGEDVRHTLTPWADVLLAEDIHPFRPPRQKTAEGDAVELEESATFSMEDELNIEQVELPDAEVMAAFSLDALKEKLGEIIAQEAVRAPILLEEINPMTVLEKLRVQSIVMSPAHYVQMNGRKLKEGETFYVPLALMRSYQPVERAVKLAVPQFADEERQKEVDMNVLAILKAHKLQRAANPRTYMVRHDVAVEVVEIKSRSVDVKILDKVYPITLNYVF